MWRDKSEILQPDSRFANTVRGFDRATGPRFTTIQDMYDDVAGLTLTEVVPADIRNQFDLARNTYVYSWFDYEIVTLAEMHAYTVFEMAIRRRAQVENSGLKPKATMRVAIDHARKMGWLKNEDFGFVETGGTPFPVLDLVVMIRNDLMHGKPHLYPFGSLSALENCFNAIRILFPEANS